MQKISILISIISILISSISAVLTFITSREANRKSEEANILSREANRKSEEANDIAKESNRLYEEYNKLKPQFALTGIKVDTSEVKVYGGKHVPWVGKEELKSFPKINGKLIHEVLTKDLSKTDTFITVNGKMYFLINFCDEDTKEDDIGIILGALSYEAQCIDEHPKTIINEISVDKTYSLVSPSKSIEPDGFKLKARTSINMNTNAITITIAYACPAYETVSLNLGSIANLALKDKDRIINFAPKNGIQVENAKEVIMFVETAYLVRLITSDNQEIFYTLYIKLNEDGRIEIANIYQGESKYNKYYEVAKSNVKKEIQIVSNEYNSK